MKKFGGSNQVFQMLLNLQEHPLWRHINCSLVSIWFSAFCHWENRGGSLDSQSYAIHFLATYNSLVIGPPPYSRQSHRAKHTRTGLNWNVCAVFHSCTLILGTSIAYKLAYVRPQCILYSSVMLCGPTETSGTGV